MGNIRSSFLGNVIHSGLSQRAEAQPKPATPPTTSAPTTETTPQDTRSTQREFRSFDFDNELRFEVKKHISRANHAFINDETVDADTYKKASRLRLRWGQSTPLSQSPEFQQLSQLAQKVDRGWLLNFEQLSEKDQTWLKQLGVNNLEDLQSLTQEMRTQELISEFEMHALESGEQGLDTLQSLRQSLSALLEQSPPLTDMQLFQAFEQDPALQTLKQSGLFGLVDSERPGQMRELLGEANRRLSKIDDNFLSLLSHLDEIVDTQEHHQAVADVNQELSQINEQLDELRTQRQGAKGRKLRDIEAQEQALMTQRSALEAEAQPLRKTEAMDILREMRNTYMQESAENNEIEYHGQNLFEDYENALSPGGRKAFAAINHYSGLKKQDTDPELNHREGMNYVYIRLMANFQDPNKTNHFHDLLQSLAHGEDVVLTASDKAVLEDFGIGVKDDGSYVNLATQKPVSQTDFKDFKLLIEYQKAYMQQEVAAGTMQKAFGGETQQMARMLGGGENTIAGEMIGSALNIMGQQDAFFMVRSAENLIAASQSSSFHELTLKVEQGIQEVTSLLSQARTELGSLMDAQESASSFYEEAKAFALAIGQIPTQNIPDFLNANIPPEILEALAEKGIVIERHNGEVTVTIDGQPADMADVIPRLLEVSQDIQAEAQEKLDDLDNQIATVEGQIDQLETKKNGLKTDSNNLKVAIEEEQGMLQQLQETRQALADRLQDPNLTAEERQALESQISDLDAEIERKQADLARAQQATQKADEVVSEADDFIEEANQVVAQAKNTADQMRQLLQDYQRLDAQLSQTQARLIELMNKESGGLKLGQKADELQRKLVLSIKPTPISVASLVKEWKEILQHYDKLIQDMNTQQSMKMSQERKSVQKFVQDMLKNEQYHMDKLSQMDEAQLKRVQDRLQQDVARLLEQTRQLA